MEMKESVCQECERTRKCMVFYSENGEPGNSGSCPLCADCIAETLLLMCVGNGAVAEGALQGAEFRKEGAMSKAVHKMMLDDSGPLYVTQVARPGMAKLELAHSWEQYPVLSRKECRELAAVLLEWAGPAEDSV